MHRKMTAGLASGLLLSEAGTAGLFCGHRCSDEGFELSGDMRKMYESRESKMSRNRNRNLKRSAESAVRIWMLYALLLVFAFAAFKEGGMTAAAAEITVDQLSDGIYAVDEFTFTGGTGRLTISCSYITVENGLAAAALQFSSSHISYVRIDDVQYEPVTQTEDGTWFEIPVLLNEDQTVIACTTAMSEPHEVTYTIHCSVSGVPYTDDASAEETASDSYVQENEEEAFSNETEHAEPIAISGLQPEGQIDFSYAENVQIYTYEDGYRLIVVNGDDRQYLVVPEGAVQPEVDTASVTVLQQPLDSIYVAATSSMALFDAIDALDHAAYSSVQAEGWYVQNAAEAMNAGDILYAGKYSQPDYELLLAGECDLAVESTMILHAPEVKEMLEGLGIPVFIDRSSYEDHPLGRTEWVKVYGVLTGHEEEAEAFFGEQTGMLEELADVEDTGKTVAFFSVNSGGTVVIRSSSDYIPKMIELAGGSYVPADTQVLGEETRSTITVSMEEFYAAAINADYLVYNAAIESPINSIEELLDKNSLFSQFKAVQEGNVWCTDKYLYQATDIVGRLIMDFHYMIEGESEENMTFLKHVENG